MEDDAKASHFQALENLKTFLAKPREKLTAADLTQAKKLGEAVGLTEPSLLPEKVRQEVQARAKEISRELIAGGHDVKEPSPAPSTPGSSLQQPTVKR